MYVESSDSSFDDSYLQDKETFNVSWYYNFDEEFRKESEEIRKYITHNMIGAFCKNEILKLKKSITKKYDLIKTVLIAFQNGTPLSSINIEDEEKSDIKIEHWFNVTETMDYLRSKGFLPQLNDENDNEKDCKICLNNKTVLDKALIKINRDLMQFGIRHLLKSNNISDHQRFTNSGPPSLAPFTKPTKFTTVDLSLDDDEETDINARKSMKDSKKSSQHVGISVFKKPDKLFAELESDENDDTINYSRPKFSSTFAEYESEKKTSSGPTSSSSLKTITSSDIQPVNSLKERQQSRPLMHDVESICRRYDAGRKQREQQIQEEREA